MSRAVTAASPIRRDRSDEAQLRSCHSHHRETWGALPRGCRTGPLGGCCARDRPGNFGPSGARVCDPYTLDFIANSRGVRPSRDR